MMVSSASAPAGISSVRLPSGVLITAPAIPTSIVMGRVFCCGWAPPPQPHPAPASVKAERIAPRS
jgi:hypothetical protein